MTQDDMDHTLMSDMHMQNMSMDMTGMQMDDGTASQPKLDRELLSNGAAQITPNNQLAAETITQPNEPCSHCMMHSRSRANFPVNIAQNNPSYQVVVAEVATGMLKSVPPSLTFVELHDHSPPGSSAALYVLVSAFRI